MGFVLKTGKRFRLFTVSVRLSLSPSLSLSLSNIIYILAPLEFCHYLGAPITVANMASNSSSFKVCSVLPATKSASSFFIAHLVHLDLIARVSNTSNSLIVVATSSRFWLFSMHFTSKILSFKTVKGYVFFSCF